MVFYIAKVYCTPLTVDISVKQLPLLTGTELVVGILKYILYLYNRYHVVIISDNNFNF